jgi:phospholipid/cholesterol/gamma-HCH transport system substrate-binding protein
LRELKVGLLIVAALVALATSIFLVGESNNLFVRKSRYFIRFDNVVGLAEGNPVQLNGVTVGRVSTIDLPQGVDQRLLTVHVVINRRYSDRVRADSEARIKTLGLLGDKYVQITTGSADSPATPDGGEILAAQATDVDELIASGENAVDNVVAISVSLRNILSRMESGEGILGQLTVDSATGTAAREKILHILTAMDELTQRVQRGEGSLGRLLEDDTLVRRVEGTLDRLEANLALVETGEGALPALLNDPETRDRLHQAIDDLSTASGELSGLAHDLREGDGLLPRLIHDDEFGRQVSDDLEKLLRNLGTISDRLEQGDGTAAQLINDPEVYEAMQDILVGIDESRMLRWLIRNRQKKGIAKRYEAERAAADEGAQEP